MAWREWIRSEPILVALEAFDDDATDVHPVCASGSGVGVPAHGENTKARTRKVQGWQVIERGVLAREATGSGRSHLLRGPGGAERVREAAAVPTEPETAERTHPASRRFARSSSIRPVLPLAVVGPSSVGLWSARERQRARRRGKSPEREVWFCYSLQGRRSQPAQPRRVRFVSTLLYASQPASRQRERESISIDRSPGVCGWLLTHPPHLTAHHESYASTPRTAPLPIVAVVEEKLAGGDAAARLT